LSRPVRAFIAVFPPLEVRKETLAAARRSSLDDRVRWIRPENVHLTLKFLGDVREEALDSICAAVGKVCTGYAPFDVGLMGLGAFPSARRARILWAGTGMGSDQLSSLAANVDAALVPLGFEREKRPYTPHMTLGRVRGRSTSLDLPSDAEGPEFRVERVDLMKSTLTQEGPIYENLKAFVLGERS
jgi:2'-5' RNA ligase